MHISKRSVFRACICPFNALLLATSLVCLSVRQSVQVNERDIHGIDPLLTAVPVEWVVGYVFGSMAGVLHCCAKMLDILDSYISVEFNRLMTAAYVSSVLGELGYVVSVLTQSRSLWFYSHTLPWILPRLIAAGLDIGILIQRAVHKKRGKRRTLSEEDAECLLSSESDNDMMSSGSEEVIWMPLKIVESAIPTHPVCASRVQILSESDKCSDTVDWCEPYQERSNLQDTSKQSLLQRTSREIETREVFDVQGKPELQETSIETDMKKTFRIPDIQTSCKQSDCQETNKLSDTKETHTRTCSNSQENIKREVVQETEITGNSKPDCVGNQNANTEEINDTLVRQDGRLDEHSLSDMKAEIGTTRQQ